MRAGPRACARWGRSSTSRTGRCAVPDRTSEANGDMSETQPKNATTATEYGAGAIRILEGLEAVRVRPAMYIGSTGEAGLHHLVYEGVGHSVDEAPAGFCTAIGVTIHIDNSVTVVDDGRGIPVGPHPSMPELDAAEVVL